ncbi:efflux RND transporter periplasmic adaptor subunit [Gallaecimonas xiamenensis]|uniref:Heavy metal efflux system protein n=1 Tax=Gallaecimonas xiamenensis 3-C-1 TaxID=745411 RepID=K2K8V5_9GAMM|nr:efflux RND transporter periplasmic adaptor subunit [Gallaecimonas xiamenensis]EKE73695.1 heavy metal efflux system protein [Gallaecimonas xiamenensis 3-C-1]
MSRFYLLLALLPALGHAQSAADHLLHQAMPASPLPAAEQPQATKYVCPMHPHVVRNEPGTCPICGMTLEPLSLDEDQGASVAIPSQMQQNLAIRVAKVERGTLWRYIETAGEVTYDQTKVRHIHPRASGWVEELGVKVEGEPVKKGQLLYRLYSPELVAAQDDFLQVVQSYGQRPDERGKRLLAKARTRLKLLGLADSTINQIEKRRESFYRVPYYAEADGTVSQLTVRDGMYVKPEQEMLAVVDLSSVWVLADVFTDQHSWVSPGISADIKVPALGITQLEGKLDYLYPELDGASRALKARFVLPNPGITLKPNMLVDMAIYGGPERNRLLIPEEALILTGNDNKVIVRNGEDFSVRSVHYDKISHGQVAILDGLKEGEEVVISGQFLIDAEASLKSAIYRLGPEGHQHMH